MTSVVLKNPRPSVPGNAPARDHAGHHPGHEAALGRSTPCRDQVGQELLVQHGVLVERDDMCSTHVACRP